MLTTQQIHFVPRQELDTVAWDHCINTAPNGLIYATHEYLDIVCRNWDALVWGDYSAVMPLVWRRKWGIYYLYYPPFCAELGVFGNNLSATLVLQFLKAIPGKFRYWDFPMNHGNNFQLDGFDLKLRTNYILPLESGYDQISANYRQNLQRNIRKAARLDYQVDKGFPVAEVIGLARLYTPEVLVASASYAGFEQIFKLLASRDKAITYGIRNPKGTLLASCAFLFGNKRAYYILVGNHPDGKTAGASHALIDAFIKDHAGRELVLDFEGSDIRNLAFFYSGYGAKTEHYPVIQLNRLPGPVRWLKK
ncbi:GNAT family N-acetyltransferase [Flavihumibacter fluvii]|uniref:GNAT family N-acetyltransferase n=1 Tax=Flavihumibacter fluvii TaxID=2838157 RepID=UPI001BDED8A7|nr:GNAT family N-acetyltransferase [Flavihumibacter fluvii]ULQ54649.1 GNAT family N-acetyltransferase [Flavihumibacter fluvii]